MSVTGIVRLLSDCTIFRDDVIHLLPLFITQCDHMQSLELLACTSCRPFTSPTWSPLPYKGHHHLSCHARSWHGPHTLSNRTPTGRKFIGSLCLCVTFTCRASQAPSPTWILSARPHAAGSSSWATVAVSCAFGEVWWEHWASNSMPDYACPCMLHSAHSCPVQRSSALLCYRSDF